MSQNDFNIANQGFPSFRSDLNSALQALASNSAGASAPSTTYAYMWWYDSTNDILKFRNADNDGWIDFAAFDQAADAWSFAALIVDGDLTVDSNTLYVDSANNRVGVGTASPSNPFQVGTSDLIVDSSGNLLVGKTSANTSTVGVEALANGEMNATVNGGRVISLDRLGSDGEIIRLRKSSATVGSIATLSSQLYIGSSATSDAYLRFGNSVVRPCASDGANRDNVIDLGAVGARFDDIYATNGTIQTSDRNEKQDIAELTVAEITAAKAISKLFKTFKWNSSVEEKGEAARIHSGVIAQDVEQAMTDAGLDAGRYAFFISSTWWELDGQTYETAEEAPEGAVEKNRKGIRYPQLLSFVGAATEQRLASIESRLDALEGN